jgi:hypothetical protein
MIAITTYIPLGAPFVDTVVIPVAITVNFKVSLLCVLFEFLLLWAILHHLRGLLRYVGLLALGKTLPRVYLQRRPSGTSDHLRIFVF